jgi:plasmid stabilization system protein ParE
MTKVELTPRARAELHEAVGWYAAHSKRAAQRFTQAYRHARQLAATAPERWMEIEPGIRRVLLHGYPYALLYSFHDKRVLILAVKHHRRHPDYWR